jgi:hypothetical protein
VVAPFAKKMRENNYDLELRNEMLRLLNASFSVNSIFNHIRKHTSVGDEFIEEVLFTHKDIQYAFSILSLLYSDYRNNIFHKDHIHSAFEFDNLGVSDKENYGWHTYNSIYNLQMLDANKNMSKSNTNLLYWVEKETNENNRTQFLNAHLIPDVDLNLNEYVKFQEKWKELLLDKMKTLLNEKFFIA